MTLINLVYFDIFVYLKFVQRFNRYKTNLEGDNLSRIQPRIKLGISLWVALRGQPDTEVDTRPHSLFSVYLI